jgi:hypothetical protein
MLVSYIFRGIEVSIELIAALTAEEKRLRAAIVASLVATARTRLTGVSRINLDRCHPTSLSFIGQEAILQHECIPYAVSCGRAESDLLNWCQVPLAKAQGLAALPKEAARGRLTATH